VGTRNSARAPQRFAVAELPRTAPTRVFDVDALRGSVESDPERRQGAFGNRFDFLAEPVLFLFAISRAKA
jgi:hypothetical protein